MAHSRLYMMKVILLIMLALTLLLLPVWGSQYALYIGTLASIGVILVLGVNIFFGHCGQPNFGTVGFYLFGAYAYALLRAKLGLGFLLSSSLTVVMCCIFVLLMSLPLLRLREYTLALGTFTLAYTMYLGADKWRGLTGGGDGLEVPQLIIWGHPASSELYYFLALGIAALSYILCQSLMKSNIGLAIKAIRENEKAATSSGIWSSKYWVLCFLINGVLAGVAGIILTQRFGWIAPDFFGISTNILIILAVVIGGLASNLGSVIGGALIMLLPELLGPFGNYQAIIYGLLLFFIIRFLPDGIAGFLRQIINRIG